MFYNLEEKGIKEVLDFINHESDTVPAQDTVQSFMNVCFALQSEIAKAYRKRVSELSSKERCIERLQAKIDKFENRTPKSFDLVNLDSIDVARCIIYLIRSREAYYTRNTVQYMLYEAYASWLCSKKERLFDDKAQAQEWGPHFWHVSNKLGNMTKMHVDCNDWKIVAERYPDIAAFLKNVVNKYISWSEKEFKEKLTSELAYKNAKPRKPGDKWGQKLSDDDIFSSRR